jgi:hypothetical protein
MAKKEKTKAKDQKITEDKNTPENVPVESKKEVEKQEKPPKGQMFIKVYSPFKVYFEDLGNSITAENDTGVFDILAGHHKFLTLLSQCEIKIDAVNKDQNESIKIDRGIMFVKEDRVTVFLDV